MEATLSLYVSAGDAATPSATESTVKCTPLWFRLHGAKTADLSLIVQATLTVTAALSLNVIE